MAARGRGYFALYRYSENLKKSFPRKVSTRFSNNNVENFNVPRVTLYKIPSSNDDWSKTMATRGRGYFALYRYIVKT